MECDYLYGLETIIWSHLKWWTQRSGWERRRKREDDITVAVYAVVWLVSGQPLALVSPCTWLWYVGLWLMSGQLLATNQSQISVAAITTVADVLGKLLVVGTTDPGNSEERRRGDRGEREMGVWREREVERFDSLIGGGENGEGREGGIDGGGERWGCGEREEERFDSLIGGEGERGGVWGERDRDVERERERDNNNNNRIQRRYSRFFTISSQRREQSPTRILKWPGRNCVQTTCNTSGAYHVQVSCYVPLGTKGQLSY